MTVCNACRYCEQYCPVFPAMEQRLTFATADLAYLANLCHNCGECLYACQYAPPHEFGINVPRTLAEIRLASYEDYCWPAVPGRGVQAPRRRDRRCCWRRRSRGRCFCVTLAEQSGAFHQPAPAGDFYAVVPHGVMVALFGAVGLFVVAALAIGLRPVLARDRSVRPPDRSSLARAS